jgi:hypothetical protein
VNWDSAILVEKFKFIRFSLFVLVLTILITVTGGSVKNAFGSIEDSVDEIVESAEDRGDQAREEAEGIAEGIAEEAREDSDNEARDRDNEEDEEDEEDDDSDSSDDNNSGDDTSSDLGSEIEDKVREIKDNVIDDENDAIPGLGEGSGMQIFVSPRERVNEILDTFDEDFNNLSPTFGGLAPSPGGNGLQELDPSGIIEGSLNILFPTGGVGASPGVGETPTLERCIEVAATGQISTPTALEFLGICLNFFPELRPSGGTTFP